MSLTKEILQKKYVVEKLNQQQIANLLGCSTTTIRRYLLKFNITLRTASELNSGKNNPFFGKKHSNEVIKIISKTHKGKTFKHTKKFKENHSKLFSKERNPNWQGGKADFTLTVRHMDEYKEWRFACFERDNFSCVVCGDNKGHNLNVDHIKPLAFLLVEFDIKTCEQARICRAIWDISNGRTLCKTCHKKTDTWGHKTSKMIKSLC